MDRGTDIFAADLAIRLAGADDAQIDAVIVEALSVVGQVTGAGRCYITSFSDDRTMGTSHEWTLDGVVPQRGAIQRLNEDRFPFSSSLARRGEMFMASNIDELPADADPERESFAAFGIHAVLQVPILVSGDLLGVLGLNHTTTVSGWPPAHIDTVTTVARAIGIALNRRSSEQRLRRALDAAERANRAKDELIARAGHELRTPLHAVIGFAEILELDGVDNEALQQIQRSSASLLEMIDDLLELGRLTVADAGTTQRRQVHQILGAVLHDLAPTAAAHQVQLVFEPVTTSRSMTSALRVHQVLHCVVAAAIVMAGDNGTVELTVCRFDEHCLVHLRTSGPASVRPVGLAFALAQSFVDDLSGTINWKSDDDATDTGVVTTIEVVLDQTENL